MNFPKGMWEKGSLSRKTITSLFKRVTTYIAYRDAVNPYTLAISWQLLSRKERPSFARLGRH